MYKSTIIVGTMIRGYNRNSDLFLTQKIEGVETQHFFPFFSPVLFGLCLVVGSFSCRNWWEVGSGDGFFSKGEGVPSHLLLFIFCF